MKSWWPSQRKIKIFKEFIVHLMCSLVFESSPGKKKKWWKWNKPPLPKKGEKKKSNNTTSQIPNITLLCTISIHGWRNLTELPVVWGLAHSCYTIYCKSNKFWLHYGILLAMMQKVEIRQRLRKGSTDQIFTSWPRYCMDSHKTKRRITMMHKIICTATCFQHVSFRMISQRRPYFVS